MTTELAQQLVDHQSNFGPELGILEAEDVTAAAVKQMRFFADRTGLPFMCVDSATGTVHVSSDVNGLTLLPEQVRDELPLVTELRSIETASGLWFHALPLPDVDGGKTVAVTYLLPHGDVRPHDVVLAAAERNWSQEQLEEWYQRQPRCDASIVRTMLALVLKQVEQDLQQEELQSELVDLSGQIEQTYEEISLLHSLTQNLQISRSPAELAEVCLGRMHALIKSDSNAIWLEDKNGTPSLLVEGKAAFDEIQMAQLIARFENHDWARPLVKNHVEGTLLGADFPGLKNLVIVPIAEGTHRFGWMFSSNLRDGREFGTVEASLLSSVATILGTHMRNIDLYEQHEELLLGFARSMVSTLDAKDPYTRGHSDRVGLIARKIGEELDLPEEDLYDIYLAGLLHDIGKIGVDDQLLRKPGTLTNEEFKQIQKHPMIGYQILHGLKNLQKVIPGVRNHHEAYNGKGYPDGLQGECIPLMARILAVADSYDAMGSNRPYRQGMPLETIEKIFRRGAGSQWDARIIDAYFEVREEIIRICENYSPDDGDLLEDLSGDSHIL